MQIGQIDIEKRSQELMSQMCFLKIKRAMICILFAIRGSIRGSAPLTFLLRVCVCVCVCVQLCPTLCDPVDCSWLDSFVYGILQARMLEWGCHFLLEGIFPTQGSNPHLLHLLH